MALITVEDVEAHLGRPVTMPESARIDALIAAAAKNIVGYTGQTIEQAETTERLRVRRDLRVTLPQRPVNDVSAVVDVNAVAVTFTWHAGEIVELSSAVPSEFEYEARRTALEWVDVTYDHGYATVPADIAGVACQIVGRSLGTTPAEGGITAETIGGYSYQRGAAAGAGPFGLLAAERAVLDRYRRQFGYVRTL